MQAHQAISQLFPVAAGVIPTLLAFWVQQGLHRPIPVFGNIFLSIVVAIVTVAGWIVAMHAAISNVTPTHFWRLVVYLALILPTVGICLTIGDALYNRVLLALGRRQLAKPVWMMLKDIEKKLTDIERRLPPASPPAGTP